MGFEVVGNIYFLEFVIFWGGAGALRESGGAVEQQRQGMAGEDKRGGVGGAISLVIRWRKIFFGYGFRDDGKALARICGRASAVGATGLPACRSSRARATSPVRLTRFCGR
jgi:hypothetical protein